MNSEPDELDACMRALVIADTPDAARLAAGWARLSTSLPPSDGGGGAAASAQRGSPRGWMIAGTTAITAAVVAWIGLRDPAVTRADADAPTNATPGVDMRTDDPPPREAQPGEAAAPVIPSPATIGAQASALARAEAPTPTAARARRRAPVVPGVGIEAELALLDAARSARREGRLGDAERSLREHAKRFADGQLAPEREVELAEVLCARGRVDAARTIVDRFLRAHAGSHLRERMRTACSATGATSP